MENLGGRLRGNIVLIDRALNLVSVVTICYWMFTGRKIVAWAFSRRQACPTADIAAAGKFGAEIGPALVQGPSRSA